MTETDKWGLVVPSWCKWDRAGVLKSTVACATQRVIATRALCQQPHACGTLSEPWQALATLHPDPERWCGWGAYNCPCDTSVVLLIAAGGARSAWMIGGGERRRAAAAAATGGALP